VLMIAFAAKGSSDGAAARDPVVAMGIVGSGHIGTIALEECDRRAVARFRGAAPLSLGASKRSAASAETPLG